MNTEAILKALGNVQEPDLKKDLVTLNMVRDIVLGEKSVEFTIVLTTPACPLKEKIRKDCEKAIHDHVDDALEVIVNFTANTSSIRVDLTSVLPGVKNIIAVVSGKGGVGKSTVTANLAVTLAKMGFSVGILDADIYGPSMPIMFDVENEKPISVTIDGKSKMKPVESYEVKILSIGFFTAPSQAVIWRGPMASKALNQMIFDADWGELDFLLVDLPPGTGDIHLSIVQSLPITGVVVVSTPQAVALADAKKGVSMFTSESINVPVLGIIENMAYFIPEELPTNKYYIFGKEGAKNLADDLHVSFLGEVPIVQSIREAGDYGRPAAMQEGSIIASVFEEITKKVVEETVNRNQNLPASEAVKITTMAGCSAVKK